MPKESPKLITLDEATQQLAEKMAGGDVETIQREVISRIFEGAGRRPTKPVFTLSFIADTFAHLNRYEPKGKNPVNVARHSITLEVFRGLDQEAFAREKAKNPEANHVNFMRDQTTLRVKEIKLIGKPQRLNQGR